MTTTAAPVPVDEIMGDLRIIDADSHFAEPRDLWTSRAPAPLVMTVRPVRTVRPVESGHPAPHVTTGPSEAIGPHVPLARHGRATSLVGTAPTRQRVARGVPAAQ